MVSAYAATDPGPVRSVNEDAFLLDVDQRLYAVADGMGGHNAGEVASKLALGPRYARDKIADQAQRDFLFYVLRDREAFPHRTGKKFYCCPACTSKLYECVSARVFRYIDNARWKVAIEQP